MTNISIAVCILFYEKVEQTVECISSFLPSGISIYVLNNGSSQAAREILRDFCALHGQIKMMDSDVNLGVAVGRNRLISDTTEEWLFFVDNDITIRTSDWVGKLKQHVQRAHTAEVFIPRVYNIHENRYMACHVFTSVANKVEYKNIIDGETNCFPGGAAFVKRQLFSRLGLYDNRMFVGLEDYELAIRGIMMGDPVRAKLIGDIELVHSHRQIKNESDRKAVLARYNVHNIKKSVERIKEKHNVTFKMGWKHWPIKESKRMIRRDGFLSTMIKKALFITKKVILRRCDS